MDFQKPTHRKHSKYHDYSLKCIYHITLVVKDRKPILGSIVEVVEGITETVCPWAHLHEKGEEWYGKAWMNLTPLGMVFTSLAEVRAAVAKAVDFYNTQRPHMSLDMLTPQEASHLTGPIAKRWTSYRERAILNQPGIAETTAMSVQ